MNSSRVKAAAAPAIATKKLLHSVIGNNLVKYNDKQILSLYLLHTIHS